MDITQADISAKPVLFREASAWGRIRLKPETVRRVRDGRLAKGDALTIAKTMAVVAGKKTPDMLALCHPLRLESTKVETKLNRDSIEVTVSVTAHEKTGVEMEALTAVSVALLNIWDVVKAYEKDAQGQYPSTRIEEIRVVKKVKHE
ncbi:MAG: cyclic pyranopterin monophosphate synthase MoaC [Nitrososphaerales archaeon]|jgi:cyclic pyranopterin phosphate synthase